MKENRFTSRKFIVTLAIVSLTTGLAIANKLSAEVSTVFTTALIGYNLANAYVAGKNGNGEKS